MPGKLMILALAMVMIPAVAVGQEARNTAEFVRNEAEIARDKAQIQRDSQEIKAFADMLASLDAMPLPDSQEAFLEMSRSLRKAMSREYEQAKRKLRQSNREVGAARRELRHSRQEASATGRVVDQLQRGDDRRDLRDDRRDRHHAKKRADHMKSIIHKANVLDRAVVAGEVDAMQVSKRLMGEFLEVMRKDMRATAVELGEDRRERREDRRERITDRNK